MNFIETIHERYIHEHRVNVLSRCLSEILPVGINVLDVGCGDGRLSASLAAMRPDIKISGLEVMVRPSTKINVSEFDGCTIPCEDNSHDVVLFVDVLHHAEDACFLLKEAGRVARRMVVIKDHQLKGFLAKRTLRFMDWIGNARHGVALPYCYWTYEQWQEMFKDLGFDVISWNSVLGLYMWPLSYCFDRSLHFLACLDVGGKKRA